MNHSNQATPINHHSSGLAILVVLLVISTACQPTTSVPASTTIPFNVAQIELRLNQQKWQDAGISHYRFGLFFGCPCPASMDGPFVIEVKNDQVVSMQPQSGHPLDPYIRRDIEHSATIDLIFSKLEKDLNGEADEVTVTYDPTYGFPTKFYNDPDKNMIDDELTLIISDFEVLP